MPVGQAVSRFIPDGCQLAIGGFSITRNPMALAYEIVRQRVRDLHVVCHSHGQALDVLIGAGCVKRLEIAYGGNGRYAPTCVRFKKAVERSEIEFEDYSNYPDVAAIPRRRSRNPVHSDKIRAWFGYIEV